MIQNAVGGISQRSTSPSASLTHVAPRGLARFSAAETTEKPPAKETPQPGAGDTIVLKTPVITRGGMNAGLAPKVENYRLSNEALIPVEVSSDVINQGSSYEAVPNILQFGPFHKKNIIATIGGGLIIAGYQLARKLFNRVPAGAIKAVAQQNKTMAVLAAAYKYVIGPTLAFGLASAGLGLAMWGQELYLLGKNVARFRAYQNTESPQTKRIVAKMNAEVAERFPKASKGEKPEIILKGHSAGGAEVLAVAKYAEKHPEQVNFKVKHIAVFGSPLTYRHLSELPKNVSLTYVRGTRDKVHNFGEHFGWLIGLFVCKDPKSMMRPGDRYFERVKNHDELTQIDDPEISEHIYGNHAAPYTQVEVRPKQEQTASQ